MISDLRRTGKPAHPGGAQSTTGRPPRRSRWALLLAGVVVVAAVVLIGRLAGLLPSFGNPFSNRTVDRSPPAVLEALSDLSQYRAASGYYQIILDVEEDTRFVPSFLKGERTFFTAAGTVDAYVDFSGLGEQAVTVSEDRRSVQISLPSPALAEPRVDPGKSRVVSRDRGLLDRIGSVFSDNPTGEREFYLLAQERMKAAALESDVLKRAEENTTNMLQGLMRSLGFTDIQITYQRPDNQVG